MHASARLRGRPAVAGAAGLLAFGLVAACGGGSDTNGLENDGAGPALKRITAVLRQAGSVHLIGRFTDEGRPYTIDARVRGADSSGRLGVGGRSAEFVVLGDKGYVRGDPDVLMEFGIGESVALHGGDRWLKGSADTKIQFGAGGLSLDGLARTLEVNDSPLHPAVESQELGGAKVAVLTQQDGSKLYAARTGAPYPLRTVEGDGTGQVDLTEYGAQVSISPPAGAVDVTTLPPAGTIAFASDRGGTYNIYTVSPDGNGLRQVTHFTDGDISRPALSPDGTRVVFQRVEEGHDDSDIWIVGEDGSGVRNLSPDVAKDGSPTWSADGATITFVSNRAGGDRYELFRMKPDGTEITQVTHRGRYDTEPAYSLDGDKTAFLECAKGFVHCALWAGTTGGATRRLIPSEVEVERPTWSPDGTKIAYTAPPDASWDVFVVNADGSGRRTLGASGSDDGQPAWSPDGTSIAFVSTRDGRPSLYVMDADGTDVRRITTPTHGQDEAPSWQR